MLQTSQSNNERLHPTCSTIQRHKDLVLYCRSFPAAKSAFNNNKSRGGGKRNPYQGPCRPACPKTWQATDITRMMGGQTAIIIYPFVLSPFYRTGGSVRPAVLPIEPTSPPFSSKFSRSNQQLLTFKVQIYLPLLVALLKATLNRRSYTTAPQLAFCFSFVCNKQAPPLQEFLIAHDTRPLFTSPVCVALVFQYSPHTAKPLPVSDLSTEISTTSTVARSAPTGL